MTRGLDKRNENNLPEDLMQKIMETQNEILKFIQTKSVKDDERDARIDKLADNNKFLMSERELTTGEYNALLRKRAGKVYKTFGDEAEKCYKGEKIFGYALKIINEKIRERARLARPMKSTQIRDYHEVMDAIDAITITQAEVENRIEAALLKREKNSGEWFKNNK